MSFDVGPSAKWDVAFRSASPARSDAAAMSAARRSLSTALRQSADDPCAHAATGSGRAAEAFPCLRAAPGADPSSNGMEL